MARKIKDLTGQVFENITVLACRGTKKISGQLHSYFMCVCHCGNYCDIPGYYLTSGWTKSCGCIKEFSYKNKIAFAHDLTGKVFGKLKVIKFDFSHWNKGRGHSARFLCVCECGNQKIVRGHNLTAGTSQSCGCVQKEIARKNMKILNRSIEKPCKTCGNLFFTKKNCCENYCNIECKRTALLDTARRSYQKKKNKTLRLQLKG